MVNSELRIQISSENRIRRRYSNLEFRIHYSPFTILPSLLTAPSALLPCLGYSKPE